MYRRFYIQYYLNGELQRQRIRRWANEHRHIFPEYGFTNTTSDFPITHIIAFKLENNYGFEAIQIFLRDAISYIPQFNLLLDPQFQSSHNHSIACSS